MPAEVDPDRAKDASAPALRRLLDAGLQHHYAGRLGQAEALYREAQALQPDHPDALHLLGMIAFQSGRIDTAVDLITKAIALDPANADYHFDFGDVRRFQGRLDDAAACYRKSLSLRPDHAESHFNLGNALSGQDNLRAAIDSYRSALASRADFPDAHNNLGTALARLGRHAEAIESFRKAVSLFPQSVDFRHNLGNSQQELRQYDDAIATYTDVLARNPEHGLARFNMAAVLRFVGRTEEAIAAYRTIIAAHPDIAEAHYQLGLTLHARGTDDEAIACHRRALAIKPGFARAHNDLGIAELELGRIADAEASFRSALSLDAGFAKAHNNLGNALHTQGSTDDAIASYRAALSLEPEFAEAHNNLGNVLKEAGMADAALACYRRALLLGETPEFKANFAACAMNIDAGRVDAGVRALIERAVAEPWRRPADLVRTGIRLVKAVPAIRACIDRATEAWPGRIAAAALFGDDGLAALGGDSLLLTLLESAPASDADIERLLTLVRHTMLDAAEDTQQDGAVPRSALALHCAVARQCYINEYVFPTGVEELVRVDHLRGRLAAALQTGEDIPAPWVVAAAAYFPLNALPGGDSLLQRTWPDAIAALLAQQIVEPLEEVQDRAAIPTLTPIDDPVSRSVQQQYEEHPYPRWVKVAPLRPSASIDAHLQRQLPFARFHRLGKAGPLDILIAGCGTGQQPIERALQFPTAHVLAVDLSRASLAYAVRKSREARVANIEYAQGDILALTSTARAFDVIEAVGVLHHLADPLRGWRSLLSMLRPGGFMLVGLYSERAREAIFAARRFIADEQYGSNAAEIRRCRQDLLAMDERAPIRRVTGLRDFYTMSECRDMLFHVQEQRFTMPQLATSLASLGVTFLGFVLEPRVLHEYGRRFPDDLAKRDFGHWDAFEADHPDTFAGMYTFWIQKPA